MDIATDNQWDITIIGSGPSGSSAAIQLVQKGFKVLLLDKEDFPRHKICGDGLIPDSIQCLKKIGVYDSVKSLALSTPSMDIFSSSLKHIRLQSDFMVIKRYDLDNVLLQKAIKLGAHFSKQHVTNVEEGQHHVHIHTKDACIQSKYAIIATGGNIGLLRKLGLKSPFTPSAVAIRGYFQGTDNIDALTFQIRDTPKMFKSSYGWIFPLPNNQYNIGYGLSFKDKKCKQPNLQKELENFISSFPIAKKLFESGEFISKPSAAILRTGLSSSGIKCKRILAIGESISTTFPLTGEGIGKAMETGLLAADAIELSIQNDNPGLIYNFYDHISKKLDQKYTGYRLAEKWFNKKWFVNYTIDQGNKLPSVKNRMVDVLEEKVDFNQMLTWRKITKKIYKSALSKIAKTFSLK